MHRMQANWIELRCCIEADAREDLEAFLEAAGASSITLTEGDRSLFQESGTHDPDRWERLEIRAQFKPGKDLIPVLASMRDRLPPGTPVEMLELEDRDWEHSWKEHWQPQLFAGGLCVCPSWCIPPPSAIHVVFLEPGRAFGTGTHETTALCLDWLAGSGEVAGKAVVDYGCGSGILALAAGRLGAATTFAVDIDDEALDVTRDNARVNGMGDRVRTGRPELLDAANADIIVANILLEPLLTLESRFQELLSPGGWLVLSGLLVTQIASVLEVYSRRFNMEIPVRRGEWVLLSGRRR